jgi:hypothetical protein
MGAESFTTSRHNYSLGYSKRLRGVMCKPSLSATLSIGEVRRFDDLTHKGLGSPINLITVRKHAPVSVQCHRPELQYEATARHTYHGLTHT